MFLPLSLLFVSPTFLNRQTPRRITSLSIVSIEHATEVFHLIDTDGGGTIDTQELGEVLKRLDINASQEDAEALSKYLDVNNDGDICDEDFITWYQDAANTVETDTNAVRQALIGRRTVNNFDKTPVPDKILINAIEAAISAPNHKITEPWRFIKLGSETIRKIAFLNASEIAKTDVEKAQKKIARWENIPGWCVVTCAKSSDKVQFLEDYAATSCAIQNFQLSMWADGVGVKWTTGPVTKTAEFNDLCAINREKEEVVGCLWYGFASGGILNLPTGPNRKKSIDSVLSNLP